MKRRNLQSQSHRRRGMIFVAALGIIVILSGLVLVFAQNMRTEAQASANHLAYQQADAVELGAEQWVLAQVQTLNSQAGGSYMIATTPAAGVQVGGGYFWVLQPNPLSDQNYQFGICDESAKLNLNSATVTQLSLLPSSLLQQNQNIVDAIQDWRSPANKASGQGAESAVYNGLTEPYNCKNAPYETVEELLLVNGVTSQVLFGYDLNRDGVIDAGEQASGNSQGLQLNNTISNDSRGIINYLTVYSTRPATAAAGGTGGGGAGATGGGGGATAAPSVGLINVLTAPEQVLMCLPGMTTTSAQQIVSGQAANYTAKNTQWVSQIIGTTNYNQISRLITATSMQYSADIVAVSGDGRSYKRVKIVVDIQKSPAKIVYRKDLTSLGWPLPQEVRDSLRQGKGVPQDMMNNSPTSIGTGLTGSL